MNDEYKIYLVYENDIPCYVGVTKQSLEKRLRNYHGDKREALYNATHKYKDWKNHFRIVLLDTANNYKESREKEYILTLFYMQFFKLYNRAIGDMKTPEYKQKISDAHKKLNKVGYWKGKSLPKETIEKIKQSKSKKIYWHTDDWREQHSIDIKGKKNGRARKVMCTETNTIYNCIKDAAVELNISYSSIRSVCCGSSKSAGGYHFKYYKEKGEEENE